MGATAPAVESPGLAGMVKGRKALAKLLNVHPATVDRHRKGLPAPIKIGRCFFWDRQAVLDHLKAAAVQT